MTETTGTPRQSRLAEGLLLVIAAPIIGILLGGVYSIPALKITKEREPFLSGLLIGGLAITVFGIGHPLHAPFTYLLGVWLFTLLLLVLARLVYGSLGHSLERFGLVHVAAIAATLLVSAMAYVRTRSGNPPRP